jgi:hypothetical protein
MVVYLKKHFMRRAVVCLVLVLPVVMTAPVDAQQPKVIKDQVEYNSYMSALNTQDPGQKAALMEAFVKTYPGSVVKSDALDYAMAGYQQAGNASKAEAVALQIVAASPDHYRALLIISYAKRARAAQQKDPKEALALASEAQTAAEHALLVLPNAPLPEGVTREEFDKQRAQIAPILHGIVGFGLLQKKSYQGARDEYLKSDLTDLQNAFQLALCELEMTPIDIAGFWHLVKAAKLAETQGNAAGAQQIAAYGQAKYKKYHGNTDGWDAFAAAAKTEASLPPHAELEKIITRAPTLCEIAVQAVNDAVKNDSLNDLSFSDYEFVLQHRDCSPANKEAAEKVWEFIQAKQKNGEVKLKLVGVKVVAVTRNSLDAALTEDNQKDKRADLHVSFTSPITKLPAVGSMVDITGVITGYTPDPFTFKMERAGMTPPSGSSPK